MRVYRVDIERQSQQSSPSTKLRCQQITPLPDAGTRLNFNKHLLPPGVPCDLSNTSRQTIRHHCICGSNGRASSLLWSTLRRFQREKLKSTRKAACYGPQASEHRHNVASILLRGVRCWTRRIVVSNRTCTTALFRIQQTDSTSITSLSHYAHPFVSPPNNRLAENNMRNLPQKTTMTNQIVCHPQDRQMREGGKDSLPPSSFFLPEQMACIRAGLPKSRRAA